MRYKRFWLELVAVCAAVACASAIALAIISATAALAVARPEPAAGDDAEAAATRQGSFTGVVTDSACGARHMKTNMTAAECTRDCLRNGAKYQLVTSDKTYMLDGKAGEVDRLAGQRVQVLGLLDGNIVTIKSIAVRR